MNQGSGQKQAENDKEQDRGLIRGGDPNKKIEVNGQNDQLSDAEGDVEFRQPPQIGGQAFNPPAIDGLRSQRWRRIHRELIE
jgi:hypothetical protein